MANKSTVIRITHAKNDTSAWRIDRPASSARAECVNLAALLERIAAGMEPATVEVGVGGTALVRASATATIVSAAATDSITINGVELAGIANGGTPSGDQWCVGAGGTADADSARALAAAINASATAKVKNYVTATAAGNVVTISAKYPGLLGNCITLVDTGTTITVTGSGFLTGGAGDDVVPTTYTRS